MNLNLDFVNKQMKYFYDCALDKPLRVERHMHEAVGAVIALAELAHISNNDELSQQIIDLWDNEWDVKFMRLYIGRNP